jgi:hypothetical protein
VRVGIANERGYTGPLMLLDDHGGEGRVNAPPVDRIRRAFAALSIALTGAR